MVSKSTPESIFEAMETIFGPEEFNRRQYTEDTTTYQFFTGIAEFVNVVVSQIESINAQNNIYSMTSIEMLREFTEPFGYFPIEGRSNLITISCNAFFENKPVEELLNCTFKVTKKDDSELVIWEDTYKVLVYYIFDGRYTLVCESAIKQPIDMGGLEVAYQDNVEGITLESLAIEGIYNSGAGLETAQQYRDRFLDSSKDFYIAKIEYETLKKYNINVLIGSRSGVFGNMEYSLTFLTQWVPEECLRDIVKDLGQSNLFYSRDNPFIEQDVTFEDGSIQKVGFNYYSIKGLSLLLSYNDSSKENDIQAQEEVIQKLLLLSYNQTIEITQLYLLEYLVGLGFDWITGASFVIDGTTKFTLPPSSEYFYQILPNGITFLNEEPTQGV